MTQLTINPDFKALIPPLSDEEFLQLEENILTQGQCRDTIKAWKGTIVDGHNRYTICQKHGIPYDVTPLRFASKRDATIWILENQLGRRNLTDAAIIKLALQKTELLREKARENQSQAGGSKKGSEAVSAESSTPASEPIHLRKTAARLAGVSEQKIHRFMKVMELGDPELIRKMESGEIKINTAYREMEPADPSILKKNGIPGEIDQHRPGTAGRPILEVVTRTVEEIPVTPLAPEEKLHYLQTAVLQNIERIERMYVFIANNASYVKDGEDIERVLRRLRRQRKVAEGIKCTNAT